MDSPFQLTKTLFLSGLACPKRLWWEVHEPDAPELVPNAQTQWHFLQGQEVTRAAQSRLPDARHEFPMQTDGLYARIDILAPSEESAPILIEVKGSTKVKDEHRWDVAFQRHVAASVGLKVSHVELMHLNPRCRYPAPDALFIREDLSEEIVPLVAQIPVLVKQLTTMLRGPLPGDSRNANCGSCPFYDRCWSQDRFSVNRFYRMKWSDKLELERGGAVNIADVPEGTKLNSIQRRQHASALAGDLVVEPTLGDALEGWVEPLVYLDFETVSYAIPRFSGTCPWMKIPVQFSAHREDGGRHIHHAFLADGSADPRRPLAEALIAACTGAGSVVTYHSSFEKGRLRELADAMPDLADALREIHDRVVDLEPMLTHHVYHPEFRGSFSLKVVLPTLCPDTTYDGLAIADGGTAQLELARLLEPGAAISPTERAALRSSLLAYCERDTWAMVVLHRRLKELASARD